MNIVINYDFPSSHEDKDASAVASSTPQDPVSIAADTYLHRVGRAGRFGNRGLAVSFLSSELDRKVPLTRRLFFFVPTIVFSSILRVFSTSIFGRCSNACKRASRPRSRSCLKKLTHPRTCLGPVLLAVPNFWDSCYLALSLSVWYAGNRSHVASLHPKFAPRPFSESGLIGRPLRFFRA